MRLMRLVLPVGNLLLSGCPNGEQGPIEPTYANVAATIEASCAIGTNCHSRTTGLGEGRLNFHELDPRTRERRPVTTFLNDIVSCQYDQMPRVDPGHPENSWLMIKIASMHDHAGVLSFTPAMEWDPCRTLPTPCPLADGSLPISHCPLVENGQLSFGTLMPHSPGSATPLSAHHIEMFRQWIAMGASGPPDTTDAGSD